jgi:hypothetical protein
MPTRITAIEAAIVSPLNSFPKFLLTNIDSSNFHRSCFTNILKKQNSAMKEVNYVRCGDAAPKLFLQEELAS